VKVGLGLFLILFESSDEDGVKVRGRCSRGGSLRHNNCDRVPSRGKRGDTGIV